MAIVKLQKPKGQIRSKQVLPKSIILKKIKNCILSVFKQLKTVCRYIDWRKVL
jgi:hypothetical protein